MKKIRMFCISLEPNHYKFIKDLGYTPVGLGEKIDEFERFSARSFVDALFQPEEGNNLLDEGTETQ